MTFNEIIRERLVELNWSKSDLARRLDVTPSRIRALLKQPGMSEEVAKKCLQVLGLQIVIEQVSRPEPPLPFKRVGRMSVG